LNSRRALHSAVGRPGVQTPCARWRNACRGRCASSASGALGLTTDFCVFTILMGYAPRPLLVRLVSVAVATLVTWRLNRALTFDDLRPPAKRGGGALRARHRGLAGDELRGVRRAGPHRIGRPAASRAGVRRRHRAVVGYNGHRLFAFAPAVSR